MMAKNSTLKFILLAVIHLLFWIGVYFFYTYFLGYGTANTVYVNRFSWYLMPITLILSYFVILYLIPKYLLSKKYALFVLYTIYTILISFAGILISVLYGLIFSSYLKDVSSTVLTKSFPFIILGVYFVTAIAVLLSLLYYSYKSDLKNEDLKNKFLEAQLQLRNQELSLLKMQIHPHFLFNSLNTIYGLSLQKREEASEMILKLSNLLDYILYQVQKPRVYLRDELGHIEDYIGLEKSRFPDTLRVEYHVNIDKKSTQIAPMMLLPFVENAFKHGVQLNGLLQISIRVELINNELNFFIQNSAKETDSKASGIGLDNIKKRLELLYPNSYNLLTGFVDNQYKVHLYISF